MDATAPERTARSDGYLARDLGVEKGFSFYSDRTCEGFMRSAKLYVHRSVGIGLLLMGLKKSSGYICFCVHSYPERGMKMKIFKWLDCYDGYISYFLPIKKVRDIYQRRR